MTAILLVHLAFRAVVGDRYHSMLKTLSSARESGIYAIIDAASREVLYVGESHSDRLYDTITRHFRAWKINSRRDGRRSGGTTYDRNKVLVCWAILPADEAVAAQYVEIQRLKPRDNQVDGCSAVDGGACDLPI